MTTDSLGFTLELHAVTDLIADVALWERFLEDLDRLAIARIVLATPPSEPAIDALARLLGETESPQVGDFSAPAKLDDGRPRQRAFIEDLHTDVVQNGWASYGILHTRQVPAAEPMRWVDMRTVYRTLPPAMQQRLLNLRGAQYRRQTREQPRPTAFEHPLVAAHPRTAEPLLLLPDRVRGSIVGLEPAASSDLLRELWRTVDEAVARHEHELRSGELYVWDNLSTVHTNPVFPRAHERSIWFLNVGCADEIEATGS